MTSMLENAGTLLIGIAAVFGGVLAFIKWGPLLRKLRVETVDLNVKMADNLRDNAWDSFDRMQIQMTKLQNELATDRAIALQYRNDTEIHIIELVAEARASKALNTVLKTENIYYKKENSELRERVAILEQEVASLKAWNRSPHEYKSD